MILFHKPKHRMMLAASLKKRLILKSIHMDQK